MIDPFQIDQIEKSLQPDKYGQCGSCKKWVPRHILTREVKKAFADKPRSIVLIYCPQCDKRSEDPSNYLPCEKCEKWISIKSLKDRRCPACQEDDNG